MLLLLFGVVCIVILAIVYNWNKTSDYWKKRNVVQVGGTFTELIFGNKSLGEIYKTVYDNYPNEPYVGVFSGSKPALIVRDLTNVQAVLSTDFYSFNSRGFKFNDGDVLADNLLMMENLQRWRLLRHKLTPMFTSMKLKSMYYILDTCAKDFVSRIEEYPQIAKKPYDAMLTYTLSSITASVFGIDANIKNTMDHPLLQIAKKSLEFNFKARVLQIVVNFTPDVFKFLNLKVFGDYEEFFIGAVREAMKNRQDDEQKRHDLIDLFLELRKQGTMRDPSTQYEMEPTLEVLAAQGWFYFLAGTDTSANAMHFTLLELASNPDILKRVHEEIDKVFDQCNDNVTYYEMEKLNYLDMVFSESMRKYPPTGLSLRECTQTTTLPVGGLRVEKDCMVVIPVFGIHRDPEYYPNPNKFDPERFSSENISKIPKFANLSFGEGNRNCIGNRYARLQVKSGLSWLLRKFTLRPQLYQPKNFEPSFFATKDSEARYELIPRK